MRNSTNKIFSALLIAAMVAFSGNVTAQTRRTSSGTSSTSRSTSVRNSSSSSQNRSATTTSQQVRRTTGSTNNTTATQNRTTTNSSRSSQQVRRTTGSTNNTAATQNRTTTNSSSSSQQVRRTTGSTNNTAATQNRTTTGTSSSSQQVRRTTGSTNNTAATQNRTTTGTSSSSQQVRRTTSGTNNTSATRNRTTTGTSNSSQQVRRTTSSTNNTAATQNRVTSNRNEATTNVSNTTEIRNVTINNNVSRRGLSTVGENNRGDKVVENSYSKDPNNRYEGRYGDNDRYYDDHRMDGHNVFRVHPRDRDFMPYDRIGSFWGHDPHYFGYRVRTLPRRYTKVRYYGIDYYRYGNVYYRSYKGYYVVSRPPFGIIIDTPVIDIRFRNVTFSFYSNVYRTYRGFDTHSIYLDAQNRQIARNNAILAEQNRQIAMNFNAATSSYELANRLGLAQSYAYANQEYFYSDGVFYIMSGNHYQTIVPPAGALVDELPDDYQTIVLGGMEFYRVDDTIYRTTMLGGRPYLEVLGQMYGNLASRYSLY